MFHKQIYLQVWKDQIVEMQTI